MKKSTSGFTIVELLIVIVVIGILAAITVVAFNSVQTKARDSSRMNDLRTMQKAIEMYYADNGSYPASPAAAGAWAGSCPDFGAHQNYIIGISPTYIPSLMYEKKLTGSGQCYIYRSDGSNYSLLAHLTMESVCGGDPSNACNTSTIRSMDRSCCTQPTIAVFSPGGQSW